MAQELYKKNLNRSRVILASNLCFKDMQDDLIVEELIDHVKAEEISAKDGNKDQMRAFINHLCQSDLTKTFKKIKIILNNKDKAFIVKHLENTFKLLESSSQENTSTCTCTQPSRPIEGKYTYYMKISQSITN